MKKLLTLLSILALSACSSSSAHKDSRSGDWQVMTAGSKNTMLCYAGTTPIKSSTAISDREQPFLMITRRASGKIEVSVSAGYSYKPGSNPILNVNGAKYRLFFKDKIAWATIDIEDKAIIEAMKKADKAELRAISDSDTASLDVYSLNGFTFAVKRIRELCP